MPYELSIFRRLLQGDWSPLYFPLDPTEQALWYEHLNDNPTSCTKQVYARFGQKDSASPDIRSLQTTLLSQYSLPIFVAQNHTVHLSSGNDSDALLSQVLNRLSLAKEAVVEWYHWQDEQRQQYVELFAQYSLESLTPEERRYYFYQCLLSEQVAIVQERMVQHVYQLSSDKKARKYVQDHQRNLLTYANQVLRYLDEEKSSLYSLPQAYTLPDVYRLILLNVEELIDYLEQHFGQYLDDDGPLPNHHQTAYASRLTQLWRTLRVRLSGATLSTELVTLLEEAFNEVTQLPTQKTTYTQLSYLHKLLQALGEQESVTDEVVSTVLCRINFNSQAFFNWFTALINDKLSSQTTMEERMGTLHRYRKFCKQLPTDSSLSYQPQRESIGQQLVTWVDEEIVYLRAIGAAPETFQEQPTPRIKTKLSVAELSLLIRVLFEVDILPTQTKANVYRQFSQVFDSVGKEEISVKTLRNLQYQPSRHTITELKGKVIAMMNFLNSL